MGILPILSILYALFAMGMATDAVAGEVPTPPSTPELSHEMDATLADALDKSEDVTTDDNQEEEVIDALDGDDEDGDDEVAEADTPVPLGFYQEVTEGLALDDNPVPLGSDQEVTEDLAEDDTPVPDELTEALSEASSSGSDMTESSANSKAPIVKRVVGGRVSGVNQWPWQVSLQYKSGSRYRHTCGGVLIKRNWVLTAAHCVNSRSRTYRVVAGEHDLNKVNCREQNLRVYRIYSHPGWKKNVASGNDIALLRLYTYAKLNRYVKLATLPPANRVLSRGACYVTGWGRTSTRGRTSNVLRYAYLPIVNYRICRSRSWWGRTVKYSMVCAGGNGRQSSCFGDSGGPLNCYIGRRWVVHGLSSFASGRGCNTVRKPSVFTRVSAFTSWIKRVAGC
ncbi:elastase-1-like [Alosa pseudoharengus]|uniref:elastase-1-like n=1 Tax=Alosa pseudoharengus TaxID=34774 RepID=UPI003F88C54C